MGRDDYQRLVAEHRDRIFSFALYTLRHREDAEDVTQDVLIRLWNHLGRLDPARVGAWIGRVTRNACYDIGRKRQVRQAVHQPGDNEPVLAKVADAAPRPDARAEHADFRHRLKHALAELDEPYRSVVVMREIQEMTYREIADTMERPLNTIKVYLHRGRRKLRQLLAEEEDDVRASCA